jgi:hypothetical protein
MAQRDPSSSGPFTGAMDLEMPVPFIALTGIERNAAARLAKIQQQLQIRGRQKHLQITVIDGFRRAFVGEDPASKVQSGR